jgi:hypothetical protein
VSNQNITIHPSAQQNYNAKAKELLGLISKIPRDPSKGSRPQSEVHISATITDKNIIGNLQETLVDYRGMTVGRFFNHNGDRYGLIDEGHKKLSTLAEAIQKLPTLHNKIARKFVEEKIFDWLTIRHINPTQVGEFISHLITEAQQAIEERIVFIPIANTTVQAPFDFCGLTIRSLSKDIVDEMAANALSALDDSSRALASAFIEDFRKKYQGYAIADIRITCEPDFANDLAISMVSRATDLLGIYSDAILLPDVKCTSKMRGSENIAQYTTISKKPEGGFNVKNGILDHASAHPRHISNTDYEAYKRCGLEIISEIASKEKRTDFESTTLNMASLYSRAAFTADPMEKLVHMLSALESTLLRNENEPIQQNLAERVAFFIGKKIDERKEVIRNIKHVYSLRSRYLHHGHSSKDLDEMSKFFLHVWVFYVNLVVNSGKFTAKAAFLDAIDDRKLS